jgi:hypothetical protein
MMLNNTPRAEQMTQFYFRHGAALSETDNARVQIGARGESGSVTRMENCSRCGGAGGSDAWRYTGWTCYQCRGRGQMPYTHRVFTEDKLAKLNDAATKKAAKKAAAAEAKREAERAEFHIWAKPYENLLGAIKAATGNSFLADLARKLEDHRQLTDRQLEAAATAIERQQQREVEDRASEYVGEVKDRFEFEAEVLGVYGTEGFYGHTDIVKLKDVDGNLFTWFASDYTDLERGDRITIKGTVKKHEEYRGVKQTILTRCAYTKFEVVSPDDAAQLEAVV